MEVRLALCRTDSPCLHLSQNKALFSPERLEQISRRPVRGQQEAVAGQLLLRRLLQEALPGVEFPPPFAYNQQDKPFLEEYPDLYFNISHSGRWAACALCHAPVGVDIQQQRALKAGILRKFAPPEREVLEKLPESEKNAAVCDLWSLKEAYCKCTGEGLRAPLNRAVFTLSPVTINQSGFTALLAQPPEGGYSLAVCVETRKVVEIKKQVVEY